MCVFFLATHRLLCEFHRKQSWDRWFTKGLCTEEGKAIILGHLDDMAEAATEEALFNTMDRLMSTPVYSEAVDTYFGGFWFTKKEVTYSML